MRYVNAALVALVVTAGLFFMMRALIVSGDAELEERGERKIFDFVQADRDTEVQTKDNKPKPPEPEDDQPPPPETPDIDSSDSDSGDTTMAFEAPTIASEGIGGIDLDSSDGEYLPIVKPAAIYPRQAQQRGIEGYVLLEFTVTAQGTVINPKILEAQPQGIFNKSALAAVKKYKYKPRVEDGKAIAVNGVKNKITFKMRQ
ncbi:MAG: energy transducer TonB [Kangiellaceae bacterium]|jgi:protein TonB|nr:energy transducer TonB [Kangiellaceae bacterium]